MRDDVATHVSREVFTHFLPTLFEPAELRGGTAVVIDVLRASTTICHALAAGANAVVPCGEVDDALRLKRELAGENPVLGGERDGKLIDGFDLDNSPFRYTPETVAGRTVIFTTTNGTRALLRCEQAKRIVLGTFNNLAAVIQGVLATAGPVHLVCAGTRGRITAEDVLFAGAVIDGLGCEIERCRFPDDQSRIALDFFTANTGNGVLETLRGSLGGRNCLALGFDADVARAAELNRFQLLPCYSPRAGRITRDT
jgi:2-phosphosulfolactate phosphatase